MELKDAMKGLAKIYRSIYKYEMGYTNFASDKERDIQLWKWGIEIDELRLAIPIPTAVQIPSIED